MGTLLKTHIPQRIYRTPLIIGKRQILQLSPGQAVNRIKHTALSSRKMCETTGRRSRNAEGKGGSTQTENEQTNIMNLSRLKSAENVQFPSKMTIAHEQHDNLYMLYLE